MKIRHFLPSEGWYDILLTKKSLKRLSLVVKLKLSLRMFYGRNHDICVTDDHGYVKLVVVTILSFLLTYLLPDMPLACRAATKVLHFCLSLTIFSTVPQVLFMVFISPFTVRLHVLFGLPRLRFPCPHSTLFHFHDQSSHFNNKYHDGCS